MLTLGNREIILSLLTGGIKCIRLDFILQIQLNSTRQDTQKEKHSIQELPQYRENMVRKKLTVLTDSLSCFSFRYNWQFFHLICIKEKPVSYVKETTSVHIAVVANSGFLKLQDNNCNSMGGQRIVHLIQHKCLQFSPQRILQNLI